jgi:hypothetical protein
MDVNSQPHTGSSDWNRMFKAVSRPTNERIRMIQPGYDTQVGDFGWALPRYPKDKDGLIHLSDYEENYRTIWYADFEASAVLFVGHKPTVLSKPNPFPVKSLPN